jgi:hypothetical protein
MTMSNKHKQVGGVDVGRGTNWLQRDSHQAAHLTTAIPISAYAYVSYAREPIAMMLDEQSDQHVDEWVVQDDDDDDNDDDDKQQQQPHHQQQQQQRDEKAKAKAEVAEVMAVPRWVADAARRSCLVCGVAFGVFERRHHCRRCGDVVCGSCSQHRAVLLELLPTAVARAMRAGVAPPAGSEALVPRDLHGVSYLSAMRLCDRCHYDRLNPPPSLGMCRPTFCCCCLLVLLTTSARCCRWAVQMRCTR